MPNPGHFEVYFQSVLNMEGDAGFDHAPKTEFLDVDTVCAGRQIRDVVASRIVRQSLITDARIQIDSGYLDIGYDCLAGVSDATCQQSTCCGLGLSNVSERKNKNHADGGQSLHTVVTATVSEMSHVSSTPPEWNSAVLPRIQR
jgi:hypothetical protein